MTPKNGCDKGNPSIQILNHQLFLILLINAQRSKRLIFRIRKERKNIRYITIILCL